MIATDTLISIWIEANLSFDTKSLVFLIAVIIGYEIKQKYDTLHYHINQFQSLILRKKSNCYFATQW